MSWLALALLAPLIYTALNFVDKLILERHVRDSLSMPIYGALIAFIVGIGLWLSTGRPVLPPRDLALIMLSGALNIVGATLYFRALSVEETSRIIVFIRMQPIFVLVLSFVFLGETITAGQFVGFLLILVAAVGVSLKQQSGRFRPSRALWMVLLVDLAWASSLILFKFVGSASDYLSVLSWESWGLALGGLLLYAFVPRIRRAFNDSVRTVPGRALVLIAGKECIFVVAKLLTFAAAALGPVALVSVLGSSQVFFGIVLGWALTVLLPTIFREDISRRTLARKGVFSVLLIAGIVFLA